MDRPQAPSILQANVVLMGTIVLGLLLAVVLGFILGESDFLPILLIGCAVLAVLFVVGLYRYVWQMTLFLIFFGFSYRPTGFSFGAVEIGCALGAGVAALFVWQKRAKKTAELLSHPSLKFLQGALLVWLVYVALHIVYNVSMPYRSSEFALSNSVKSYFAVSAPLALLFYFSRSPAGIVVRKDFFWTISKFCLFGLLVNLAIRFYQLVGGGGVYIPLINATAGIYALRFLGPLAMMLGCAGLTSSKGSGSAVRFMTYGILLISGAVGSTVSGGRATLVIGFVAVCALLFMRRKVVALFAVFIVGILGAAFANLSSDWINTKADPFVQRSLQWTLIHKKGEAIRSIESSTNWRRELFYRAIEEWRSDPRLFWTGRATYGFGVADETAILVAGGYQALIETSLRRGATHNLISDLLVAYGLIGLILYLTVYIALMRFLWSLYRRSDLSLPADNLVIVTFIGSILWFIYSVLGGNFYSIEYVIFLIVLIAAVYNGVGISEQPRRARAVARPPRPWQNSMPESAIRGRLARLERR